jgi:hypothetical protein
MTQGEMFTREEMGLGRSSTWAVEAGRLFESGLPPDLAEALKDAEERILASLQNLNANYTEIGRELAAAKERLTRPQFLSWLSSIGGLSQRTARSMIWAAKQQLSDPAAARLEPRQKLAQQRLKNVIRAATAPRQKSKKAKMPASKVFEPPLHDRGSTTENEERRQDGTPATLEGNIGNATDRMKNTVSRPRAQGYAVRRLFRNYRVSAATAAVSATALGLGGVR